jgi:hypothetical protein
LIEAPVEGVRFCERSPPRLPHAPISGQIVGASQTKTPTGSWPAGEKVEPVAISITHRGASIVPRADIRLSRKSRSTNRCAAHEARRLGAFRFPRRLFDHFSVSWTAMGARKRLVPARPATGNALSPATTVPAAPAITEHLNNVALGLCDLWEHRITAWHRGRTRNRDDHSKTTRDDCRDSIASHDLPLARKSPQPFRDWLGGELKGPSASAGRNGPTLTNAVCVAGRTPSVTVVTLRSTQGADRLG